MTGKLPTMMSATQLLHVKICHPQCCTYGCELMHSKVGKACNAAGAVLCLPVLVQLQSSTATAFNRVLLPALGSPVCYQAFHEVSAVRCSLVFSAFTRGAESAIDMAAT